MTYFPIIQCSMPAFRGMFPNHDHDVLIQDLLCACCEWDSLAKLRLHTESTLSMLEDATNALGRLLRQFADRVCPSYNTLETAREAAGRRQREQRKASERAQRGDVTLPGQTRKGIYHDGSFFKLSELIIFSQPTSRSTREVVQT
jgi:hypothetical protein